VSAAIVHFEIHVADVDRAQRFYSAVFDWKIEQYQGTEYYGVWTGRSKYPNGSVVGMDGGLRLRLTGGLHRPGRQSIQPDAERFAGRVGKTGLTVLAQ
jgi:predicted enzyme related to lactoylglutathione lyase